MSKQKDEPKRVKPGAAPAISVVAEADIAKLNELQLPKLDAPRGRKSQEDHGTRQLLESLMAFGAEWIAAPLAFAPTAAQAHKHLGGYANLAFAGQKDRVLFNQLATEIARLAKVNALPLLSLPLELAQVLSAPQNGLADERAIKLLILLDAAFGEVSPERFNDLAERHVARIRGQINNVQKAGSIS